MPGTVVDAEAASGEGCVVDGSPRVLGAPGVDNPGDDDGARAGL
jgi:hypothetical protein